MAAFFAPAAAELNAQDIRGDLERVYRGWVNANERKQFQSWKRYTAAHRYAITHNMVVSRKDDWPDVIFKIPFRAPDISTLRHMATLQDGPTAHLILYGKVDFGILEGREAPENILVLPLCEGRFRLEIRQHAVLQFERRPWRPAHGEDRRLVDSVG